MRDTIDLGAYIRELREKQQRSLRGLAQRAGIAVSFLAQIESGKSSPTIATLVKIAEALEVDPVSLLTQRSTHADGVLVVPRAQMPEINDGTQAWRYMLPTRPGIHALMTLMECGLASDLPPLELRPNDVCGLVITGTVTIETAHGEQLDAHPADAFYIKASIPFRVLRRDDQPASVAIIELLPHESFA